jgi:ferredoxin
MYVTDECIDCSACVDECEQNAIYQAGEEFQLNGETQAPLSDDHTFIVNELCNECKSCIEVCAVDAIEER